MNLVSELRRRNPLVFRSVRDYFGAARSRLGVAHMIYRWRGSLEILLVRISDRDSGDVEFACVGAEYLTRIRRWIVGPAHITPPLPNE